MAKYTKGFKFRIYPSKARQNLIHRSPGCCCFVCSHFLEQRRGQWALNHERLIKTGAVTW